MRNSTSGRELVMRWANEKLRLFEVIILKFPVLLVQDHLSICYTTGNETKRSKRNRTLSVVVVPLPAIVLLATLKRILTLLLNLSVKLLLIVLRRHTLRINLCLVIISLLLMVLVVMLLITKVVWYTLLEWRSLP